MRCPPATPLFPIVLPAAICAFMAFMAFAMFKLLGFISNDQPQLKPLQKKLFGRKAVALTSNQMLAIEDDARAPRLRISSQSVRSA
jgi:hypothetical protein